MVASGPYSFFYFFILSLDSRSYRTNSKLSENAVSYYKNISIFRDSCQNGKIVQGTDMDGYIKKVIFVYHIQLHEIYVQLCSSLYQGCKN